MRAFHQIGSQLSVRTGNDPLILGQSARTGLDHFRIADHLEIGQTGQYKRAFL
jgi:hypothetical protein